MTSLSVVISLFIGEMLLRSRCHFMWIVSKNDLKASASKSAYCKKFLSSQVSSFNTKNLFLPSRADFFVCNNLTWIHLICQEICHVLKRSFLQFLRLSKLSQTIRFMSVYRHSPLRILRCLLPIFDEKCFPIVLGMSTYNIFSLIVIRSRDVFMIQMACIEARCCRLWCKCDASLLCIRDTARFRLSCIVYLKRKT